MSAPRATIPLVLERPERVADGMGGYRMEWRALGILYAQMRAGSGAERQGEVGAESVVPWRITVRAARAGDPRRPVAGQRFRMGGRVFRIEAVAEAGSAGLWLDCRAREEGLT
ncbi:MULTISPECIES: head-tail adaptor protein [unclassified Paracoccus (in: a-proteobacteria)]|uniref:head-tail adaptor protein n=1 Tax=unclassified Paracoccus (in: a-proteobacteria) TaxID=2688777 RepID=UPI0016046001|nr:MULTISPECIES: head-tail adaptor protein [unclassified Paracoccus (in: a-proteobacteria)]MBB1490657.1 head-tail adaptor protein [Paracoccus sp. MC1854]MBB1497500.1 head-tail adaptor protein [Paracoccus sp. MC1862]QQO45973.1 head-tail adaptor protein [Paracoccus sp. MC1862]